MRSYLLSALTLLAVLALSLGNAAAMTECTHRWQAQLDQVEALAADGAWDQAAGALEAGYQDWSSSQVRLHIVSHHDILDEAEAMYRRCAVLIRTREAGSLLGALSDLRHQLRLLAETERLSIQNIL